MKKFYSLLMLAAVLSSVQLMSQNWVLNQVIIGSGGNFSNPDDNVKLSSYNPSNSTSTEFGSILTHSIQDIVVDGKFAYVAAQDSIAKYDIDTYEQLAIAEAIGVNNIVIADDNVFATFQYPVTEGFVKVYSTDSLLHISTVQNISGESAGLLVVDELVYAAVNGGWAGTTGNIAIIQKADYSLVDEVELNEFGKGIMDLFYYNSKIMAVNTTPWGDSTSYITSMNKLGTHHESFLIPNTLGALVGVKANVLFTLMDGGIGAINLDDYTVLNPSIIDTPDLPIATAKMDTLNTLFYVTTTDYSTIGEGNIYDFLGDIIDTFETGISPDAIEFDYRDNTSITENNIVESLIYPNPSTELITVRSNIASLLEYSITDISGKIIMVSSKPIYTETFTINVDKLESGIYLMNLIGDNQISTTKFVKN